MPAIVYVAGTESSDSRVFETFEFPTEQYLVACLVHLREHWDIDELPVHRYKENKEFEKISMWRYPTSCTSLSLAGLFVQVNSKRTGYGKLLVISFDIVLIKSFTARNSK